MPKTSQKRPKNGQITKKNIESFFWLEITSTNLYSRLKQLKMDLNALKCIQIHIPQKGPTNGKKWQKSQKITNNCKISEITKYGKKMKTNYKNVKQCKKMPKTGLKRPKSGQISEFFFIVFLARNYLKKWY